MIKTLNSQQRIVVFNLNRLPTLTGFEKIQLLRDMHNCRQTSDALAVYQTINNNNLISRLKYLDHHNMLHLLLQDSCKNQTHIKQVWGLLHLHYKPSINLYSNIISCCVSWNDLSLATEIYNQITQKNMSITTDILNSLLHLHQLHGKRSCIDGLAIWEQQKLHVKPNLVTFTKLLQLAGEIGDVDVCDDIYSQASAFIPLVSAVPRKLRKKAFDDKDILNVSYLSALVNSKNYSKAKELYSLMNLYASRPKIVTDTFNIMFKMCLLEKDLDSAMKLKQDLISLGNTLDVSMQGRIIVLLGMHGKITEAEDLYKNILDSFKNEIPPLKLMKLQACLLQVYCTALEKEKAVILYNEMKKVKILKSSEQLMQQLLNNNE